MRGDKMLNLKINKTTKRILIVTLILISSLFFFPHYHVYATDSSNVVETTFFGNLQDDGQGCGIYTILNLIVDILSIGIGIVGVIGITVAGIQYLTAKGNEQQTTKAKRRIFEIVIGIVAYVILYSFTQWLLPGGKLNTGTTCQTVSDEELAKIKEAEKKAREEAQAAQNSSNNTNTQSSSGLKLSSQIAKTYTPKKMAKLIKKGKLAPSPVCTDCSWNERIAQTAELLAWPLDAKKAKYHYEGNTYGRTYKSWSDMKGAKPNPAYRNALDKIHPKHGFSSMSALGADCGNFVNIVLRYSGHDSKMPYGNAEGYLLKRNWKKVKKAKRGDVCIIRKDGHFHIWLYLGNGLSAEANHSWQNFGHIAQKGCSSANIIIRAY